MPDDDARDLRQRLFDVACDTKASSIVRYAAFMRYEALRWLDAIRAGRLSLKDIDNREQFNPITFDREPTMRERVYQEICRALGDRIKDDGRKK